MSFRVEGIPTDTPEQATVLADRLFKRYKQTKTIHVVEVQDNGKRVPIYHIDATRVDPNVDNDTFDMFEDDPIPLLTNVVK